MLLKGLVVLSGFCGLGLFNQPATAAERDPFAPLASQATPALTQYPLSALTLVGTISRGEQRWGIVRAPDKRVYPVAVGNAIGTAHGYVAQITEQQILVEERAATSKTLPQTVTLPLLQVR